MKKGMSLATGAVVGYLAHKKIDWVLMSLYKKYPASSRFIVGISLGMGVYFLTKELPRFIAKLTV